jgi:hypothetical protein
MSMVRRWIARSVPGIGAVVLLVGVLAAQTGCVSVLATALYIIKGTNAPAEFPGLKDQRVAVVCRPLVELQYANSRVAEDIALVVGRLLKQNVRKLELVDPQEVSRWTDENNWDEYAEIGKALDADIVLGLDLEQFSLYQGQTLYQGKATVAMTVYDVEEDEVLFEKRLPQVLYPPNTGVDTSRPEEEFRRQFVQVLSDQIGRHFYAHDTRANFAQDSQVLE